MPKCHICKSQETELVFENRLICLRCDDLLLDLELERDEPSCERLPKREEATRTELNSVRVKSGR